MAVKAGDLELDLTDSLVESVAGSWPRNRRRPTASSCASTTTGCRPRTWPTAARDLGGAIVAHWRTAHQRERGEAKVSVYNPEPRARRLGVAATP